MRQEKFTKLREWFVRHKHSKTVKEINLVIFLSYKKKKKNFFLQHQD